MTTKLDDVILNQTEHISAAMRILNNAASQVVLVVDSDLRLIGTVTDGDIRRALLNGLSIDEPVLNAIKRAPKTVNEGSTDEQIKKVMEINGIQELPVINSKGQIVSLQIYKASYIEKRRNNLVVLMAGGLGSRLGDITKHCPKPLLKVGTRPIMETILSSFIRQGYWRFLFSVNYKSDMIEDYFSDGSQWGVEIEYLRENERLGTAGALSNIKQSLHEPIFVMNGDLLTNVDFNAMLKFHKNKRAGATMGIREYDIQIPYGVVETKDGLISSIVEKPVHRYFVNAGIYIIEPELIKLVPSDRYFDMPDLFKEVKEVGEIASSFPIHEYWLDIGEEEQLNKARIDYLSVF